MKEENCLTDFSLVDYRPLKDLYDLILDNSQPHNSSTEFNVSSQKQISKELCQSAAEKEVESLVEEQQIAIRFSCNCNKSKCIKNYCECYRNGALCSPHCSCTNCRNIPSKLTESSKQAGSCNCRKSKCIKKYCECHSNGRSCSLACQCYDCQNNKQTEKQLQQALITGNDLFQ